MQSAAFIRNGSPIYAWWSAADRMKEFTPSTVRLENPVVLDMLAGEVAKPAKASKAGGGWNFDVPIRDYPMLVTDASVVA